jgi:hypothetical protein
MKASSRKMLVKPKKPFGRRKYWLARRSSPLTISAGRANSTPPLAISSAAAKRGEASFSSPPLAARRSSVAVAPRPIGATQSSAARWLLLLAAARTSPSASPSSPLRSAILF